MQILVIVTVALPSDWRGKSGATAASAPVSTIGKWEIDVPHHRNDAQKRAKVLCVVAGALRGLDAARRDAGMCLTA